MKICFVGDSLIEYFDWQARFPQHEVSNLGISGETAFELLDRVPFLGYAAGHPELAVIMTGTNDIVMGADFLPAYERIIVGLGETLPGARLVACGLFPMAIDWLPADYVVQANAGLAALAGRYGIAYFDGARLVPDAAARRLFFSEDGVHLTPHGYAVWSAALEDQLRL